MNIYLLYLLGILWHVYNKYDHSGLVYIETLITKVINLIHGNITKIITSQVPLTTNELPLDWRALKCIAQWFVDHIGGTYSSSNYHFTIWIIQILTIISCIALKFVAVMVHILYCYNCLVSNPSWEGLPLVELFLVYDTYIIILLIQYRYWYLGIWNHNLDLTILQSHLLLF